MSQEYYNSDAERSSSSAARGRPSSPSPSPSPSAEASSSSSLSRPPTEETVLRSRAHDRPHYMTVGAGSTSASAAALTAMLDNNFQDERLLDGRTSSTLNMSASGRPGRLVDWDPSMVGDLPTPPHAPVIPGETNAASENERRVIASHVHQLYYNQNRVALGRAIHRTVDSLKGLQEMNSTWPAHYPTVQRPETTSTPQRNDPRPGLIHTQSTAGPASRDQTSKPVPSRPSSLRRAFTSGPDDSDLQAESSAAAASRTVAVEPRLITPQIAQEFSILKIDLKLGALSQTELVHSLEKHSIASLLDGKINQSIHHLFSLRERIEDTSSKVLVTGDLNAGKSTFCNALLRRKVLPEDQQPCTSIFCEVLDARENGGLEEVHAVHKETIYNRHDESTYDVYSLPELEKIVVDNEMYTQAKVYVKDVRSIDESLLNNGVVEISIIDAPGLNLDSLKTTAVFARQEEIDVVVFVVSAANHFTLSAKEFIWNAAREKAYIFIVVNGFDNIRDKERCQKMILEQVANLSPRTFKESSELVHFVSSNAIPIPSRPAPGGGRDGGGGGDSGGRSYSSPDADGANDANSDEAVGKHGSKGDNPPKKDKGKEKEKLRDFENLESALRRFVLEKRARSKLAPAKTYLLNVLSDLTLLATVNRDVAASELSRVDRELGELEPVFVQTDRARTEVSESIDRAIDGTCTEIYDHTRTTLSRTIGLIGDAELAVPYPGVLNAWSFAEDLKLAMLDQISLSLTSCENFARERTVEGVSSITALGHTHLGSDFADLAFRSDIMFRRRRDALARQVDGMTIDVWDFLVLSPRALLPSYFSSSPSSASDALTTTTATASLTVSALGILAPRILSLPTSHYLSHLVTFARLLPTSRRLILPSLALLALSTTALLLHAIPSSLPHRLSRKLNAALQELEYSHVNAQRLSSEVRKILRFPADALRVGLQRSVEKLVQRRHDTQTLRSESEVARKYFGNLLRDVRETESAVQAVDLESAGPGIAPAYDT